MSKRVSVLAFMLLLAAAAPAPQDGDIQWTRQFGTSDLDEAHGVITDGSGNIIVAGYTLGRFPGQPRGVGYDPILRKYDTDGDVLWTRQLPTKQPWAR